MGGDALLTAWWRRATRECLKEFSPGGENRGFDRSTIKLVFMALTGLRPSTFEANQLLRELGHDEEVMVGSKATHIRVIAPDVFENFLVEKLAMTDREDLLRQVFSSFDVSGRGFLTRDDVYSRLKEALPGVAPHAVVNAFQLADKDGDDRVGYAEFRATLGPYLVSGPDKQK